jgi:HEAT repeat protein
MIIALTCQGCGKKYEVDGALAGKRARCKRCKTEFTIPVPRSAPASRPGEDLQAAAGTAPGSISSQTSPTEKAVTQLRTAPVQQNSKPPSFQESVPAQRPQPVASPVPVQREETYIVEQEEETPFFLPADPTPDPASVRAAVRPLPTMPSKGNGPKSTREDARRRRLIMLVIAVPAGIFSFVIVSVLFLPAIASARRAAREAMERNEARLAGKAAESDTPGTGTAVPPSSQPREAIRPQILSQHEKVLQDVLDGYTALADALARIRDSASAARMSARIDSAAKRMLAAQKAGERLPRANDAEEAALANKFAQPIRAVLHRLRGEAVRLTQIRSLNGAFNHMVPEVDKAIALTEKAFGKAGSSPPSNAMADGPKSAPSRPNAPAQPAAPTQLELTITNVNDQVAADLVLAKLAKLAETVPHNRVFTAVRLGDKKIFYAIVLSVEPEAYVARIDFGRVEHVKGNRYNLVASPPTAEEIAAHRHLKSDEGQTELVIKELSDPEKDKQRRGLDSVRKLKTKAQREQVAKALENVLQTDDRFLRAEAAKLLVEWAGPESVPALIHFLEVEDFFGRNEVMDGLIKMKDPRTAEVFASYLNKDRDRAIRGLTALGTAGEKAVLPYLSHTDDGVRRSACDALKNIGSKENLALLEPLLTDRNQDVSRAADEAIDAIESRSGQGDTSLNKGDRSARRRIDQMIKAIAEIDVTNPDRDRLNRAFDVFRTIRPDHPRRADAAKALERLIDISDRGLRSDVAKVLATLAGPDNVLALVRFLELEDFFGRNEVWDALAKLKDPRSAEIFASYLTKDRDRAARALIDLGPPAEKAVQKYLSHNDAGIRRKACEILQEIGTKASGRALTTLTQDSNQEVAQAAFNALQAIRRRK